MIVINQGLSQVSMHLRVTDFVSSSKVLRAFFFIFQSVGQQSTQVKFIESSLFT